MNLYDGFTPISDGLVRERGLVTACVYGVVWRFCQMDEGQCSASLQTLAERIGIDRATAMRHIKILCEAGYLSDLTPDRRNCPHVYVVAGPKTVAESNATVAESNATVAESNATVAESQLKRLSKRLSKKDSKKIESFEFKNLWSLTLDQLRDQMTKATYEAHLTFTQAVSCDGDTLTVAVGSASLDWLERRLNGQIARVLSQVAGAPMQITFVVAP